MRKPDSIAPPGARPSLISAHSDPATNPTSSTTTTTNATTQSATSLHRRSSSSPEVEQIDNARKNVTHRRSASSLASAGLIARPEKDREEADGAAPSTTSAHGLTSKRKRLARPYHDEDDDEYVPSGTSSRLKSLFDSNNNNNKGEDESDDGGDADAEYAELRAWAGGLHSQALAMGNVSTRRRNSSQIGSGVDEGRGTSSKRGSRDMEDLRRHSMAV